MIRKTILIISTVLPLATALGWVLSYEGVAVDYVKPWGPATNIESIGGHLVDGICIVFYINISQEEMGWFPLQFLVNHNPPGVRTTFGFSERYGAPPSQWRPCYTQSLNPRARVFTVPLWQVMCLSLIHPSILWLHARRHYRRRKKGLCIKCGYDLTGNESGVCPECAESVLDAAERE